MMTWNLPLGPAAVVLVAILSGASIHPLHSPTPEAGERGPALPSLPAEAQLSNPPSESKPAIPTTESLAALSSLPRFEPRGPTWKILVVPAVPRDLWSEALRGPDPEKVSAWYATNGVGWLRETLAPELRDYFLRLTYGQVPLDIEVTDWVRLPKALEEEAPFSYVQDRQFEARDALQAARKETTLENYRLVVVLDPTSPASPRFENQWKKAWGWFFPSAEPGVNAVITGIFYGGTSLESGPAVATSRILAHEVAHAVDFGRDGRYDLLDNTGSNFCLHGPPTRGEPWLCPFNEAALLGIAPRNVGPGQYTVEPVEEGAGKGLRAKAGVSDLFIEYRRTANPKVEGHEGPAVLVWKTAGGRADLVDIFREAGRSLQAGIPVEVLSMGPGGAGVRLG